VGQSNLYWNLSAVVFGTVLVLFAVAVVAGIEERLSIGYVALYFFDVETVRQPVLIYVGEDDAVLPVSVSRHVQTRLHKAHLEVIPKIGHLGLLRDPVLRDFFESLLSLPEKEKTSLEEGLDTSLGSLEGHSLSVHKRTRAID
jgi:pimeloyl-ACP methyl ester carboxylesterase